MCGAPEHSRVSEDNEDNGKVALIEKRLSKMKETKKCFSVLLELAANNDLIGFKQAVEEDGSAIDEISVWYGRQNGSKQMGLEQRTPLMIAALFGSIDVLTYILSAYVTCGIDVNLKCGSDRSTALHCAAAGGSSFANEAVKLLLQSAADVNCFDANGKRPIDVIVVSPKLSNAKVILNNMLKAEYHTRAGALTKVFSRVSDYGNTDLSGGGSNSLGLVPHLSSSLEAQSPKVLISSPKIPEVSRNCADGIEKKEYPVDPSLPDIKNGVYSTDEFRMYSFKVRPCSRAYSHDWTECPFVHPGENARRRDPRKYHYTSVPCPEFRKGTCRRGDLCEFAHGVFECWLHPAQYRTRLCKDETNCTRRVCFFAHKPEELRPLSVFTGSAMPSPRASSSLDMNSTMSPLTLGSPSSVFMMSSLSPSNPSQGGLSTPPMSPSSSASSLAHSSFGGAWPQPNVPTLHLPGGSLQVGLQASRFRSSLNARDVPLEELTRDSDCEGQLINEFSSLSGPGNALFRSGKYRSHGSSVAPVNLEDLFASEMLSPRAPGLEPSVFSQISSQIQSHKSAQGHPQVQTPISNQISQIHQMQQGAIGSQGSNHLHSPVQPSHSMSSLSQMSSLGLDLERQNSNGSALSPALMAAMKSRSASFAQRDFRCNSSRDLGAHGSLPSIADWGSPTGKANWGVQKGELNKFRKSASFGFRTSTEPDLSWGRTPGKENPVDAVEGCTVGFSLEALRNRQSENINNAVLGAWAEQQMHLDQQMVA